MDAGSAKGTVVLVHGGFADGSGWQGVYSLLRKDGYNVSIVQNPTISLAGDVAATKQVIDAQSDPVLLVGHSYGGAVITEAGNDPKVEGLVYIAAFSRPSPRTRASRCRRSLPILRPTHLCRQFCRRRTASCSSTGQSLLIHSRPT
jgi:pimeloyl-ACP methyl ester carboxylesterase